MTIEFSEGAGGVVDNSKKTYIIDISKKDGKTVFQSENLWEVDAANFSRRLFEICKKIEKKSGPTDIEFIVNKNEIALVQKREITDIKKIEEINIPEYSSDKFIGSTNIVRGTGKITLPIVKISDFGEQISRPEFMLVPDLIYMVADNFIKMIKSNNNEYSKGYILVTDHFGELASNDIKYLIPTEENTTTDSLTSNKKAVITTNSSSLSSHIMTIARERGIMYAGFENRKDIFKKLNTGDIISIYIKGREAKIFLENSQKLYLKDTYKQSKVTIEPSKEHRLDNPFYFTIKNINTYKNIEEDALLFLNNETLHKWTFKEYGGNMGGYYINEKGKKLEISIAKCGFSEYSWSISRKYLGNSSEAISPSDFKLIVEKYVEHLK